MRFLLLFVAAAGVSAAQAQAIDAHRFAPLSVGNRWEYASTDHSLTTPVVTGYTVATVDSEVVVDGQPYLVLTQQGFSPSGVPTTPRRTCAYSRALGTAPAGTTPLPDYDCAEQAALPPAIPSGPVTITRGSDVVVSNQSVVVDSLLSFGAYRQYSGGAFDANGVRYATRACYVFPCRTQSSDAAT